MFGSNVPKCTENSSLVWLIDKSPKSITCLISGPNICRAHCLLNNNKRSKKVMQTDTVIKHWRDSVIGQMIPTSVGGQSVSEWATRHKPVQISVAILFCGLWLVFHLPSMFCSSLSLSLSLSRSLWWQFWELDSKAAAFFGKFSPSLMLQYGQHRHKLRGLVPCRLDPRANRCHISGCPQLCTIR